MHGRPGRQPCQQSGHRTRRTPELVSTGEVSIAMLRDRPAAAEAAARRLPFLESSLRVPPARSSDSETRPRGDGYAASENGLPQGRLLRQQIDGALEPPNGGHRAGTDWTGKELLIRLRIA
jgi:hypothetical protein